MTYLRFFIAKALCSLFLAGLLVPGLAAADLADAGKNKLSIDSTLGELVDNPKSVAILDRHVPGFSDDPQIDAGKFMTLRAVAPLSGGKITDKILQAIEDDLSKLK